jgi:carbonic anhydrase/acetyltransferase-like protein (isoleucine patch superfamily)
MTDQAATFRERFPGAIILPWDNAWPEIADDVFVAPGAVIVGNVTIGSESSIWFNTAIRGDIAPITIGARTSVQDNTVVHVNTDAPTVIGNGVTIGHSALVHGTTIRDGALIGMGSLVLSYSVIGRNAVVAAGALIPERYEVPDGAIMIGVPAKPRDGLSDEQIDRLAGIPDRYVRVSRQYIDEVRRACRPAEEEVTHEY